MEKQGQPEAPSRYVEKDFFQLYLEKMTADLSEREKATAAAQVTANAAMQLANQSSATLVSAIENLNKQEETIAQVKVEFKALEIKTNEDCNEAISRANNAVHLSTKLEGDVTALQENVKEIQEVESARVQTQIQSLEHKTESRLDKFEREDDTLMILGSDTKVVQESNESLKRARIPQDIGVADAHDQLLKAHDEAVKELSLGQQVLETQVEKLQMAVSELLSQEQGSVSSSSDEGAVGSEATGAAPVSEFLND